MLNIRSKGNNDAEQLEDLDHVVMEEIWFYDFRELDNLCRQNLSLNFKATLFLIHYPVPFFFFLMWIFDSVYLLWNEELSSTFSNSRKKNVWLTLCFLTVSWVYFSDSIRKELLDWSLLFSCSSCNLAECWVAQANGVRKTILAHFTALVCFLNRKLTQPTWLVERKKQADLGFLVCIH